MAKYLLSSNSSTSEVIIIIDTYQPKIKAYSILAALQLCKDSLGTGFDRNLINDPATLAKRTFHFKESP